MATITLNKKMLTKAGSIVTPLLIDGPIVQCIDQSGNIGYYSITDLIVEPTVIATKKVIPAAIEIVSTSNSEKITSSLPQQLPVEETISHSIELKDGKIDVTTSGKHIYTAPTGILLLRLN